MSIKHTPGPWNLAQSASGKLLIESSQTGAEICKEVFSGDVSEANMRLIAAAPELLEAVKTFAEWLRREKTGFPGGRDTSGGEAAWREWYDGNLALCRLAQDQASAALAKATGVRP